MGKDLIERGADISDALAREAGRTNVRTDAPIRVTPDGHGLNVWAARIAEAETLTLATLLGRLGPAARLGHPAGARGPSRRRNSRLRSADAHLESSPARSTPWWPRPARRASTTSPPGRQTSPSVGCRNGTWRWTPSACGAGRSLGLPDGRVAEHHDDLARPVCGFWLDERPGRPVILAAPWRHDPHPDHRACGRVAAAVATERGLPAAGVPGLDDLLGGSGLGRGRLDGR